MKKLNNKGFSMVELLAVVVIMGIFLIIGIPMVFNYIQNSRKTIYAQVAKSFIKEAKNKIVSKELKKMNDPDVTYYIDINYLVDDEGKIPQSPFAPWKEGYVIYTTNDSGKGFYYFYSLDSAGWMIKKVEDSKITPKVVVRDMDISSLDIDVIAGRKSITLIRGDGTTQEDVPPLKSWSRKQTKQCFSFRDINSKEIELTYYNKECLSSEGEAVIPTIVDGKMVTSIYYATFERMGVKKVVLPVNLKSIGGRAFISNSLTSIIIPNTCTSIGENAFNNNQISKVEMGDTIKTISSKAFYGNKIGGYLYDIVPNKSATIGTCAFCNNNPGIYGGSFTFSGNSVVGYLGDFREFASDKRFVIPSTTPDGKPVTSIADSAFYSLGGLKDMTVVIPEGVTSIGGSAFSFSNIAKVEWPKNSLKTIGSHAFYSNKLTTIDDIPASVTSIGTTAFQNNQVSESSKGWIYKRTKDGIDYTTIIGYASNKKNNVVIPTTAPDGTALTTLDPSALCYLGLTGTLVIPESVTTYANTQVFSNNSLTSVDNGYGEVNSGFIYARNSNGTLDKTHLFAYAGSIKRITIPSQVKKIGNYAFYYGYITHVDLNEGLEEIGERAFYVCNISGTVVIPSTVKTIKANAFYKAITWTSFNGGLNKIINKTDIAFDWKSITGGPSAATFKEGIIENWYGDITVVRE